MSLPRISIVTPNFNQAAFLETTILSVLSQGYPNLEYIIIDGGSTDGSVAVIEKYTKQLSYWVSEKDNGMYEAIQKGFEKSSGEIMGWINSDDILHPRSLFVLAKCFTNQTVNWIQGLNTLINDEGCVIATCKPYNTKQFDFLCLRYLENGNDSMFKLFGTIQQESTYWRRSLWEKSGGLDLNYKYAGDFALWMSFFRHDILYSVDSLIGAFRKRPGQISGVMVNEYLKECQKCISNEVNNLPRTERAKIDRFKFYFSLSSELMRILIQKVDREFKKYMTSVSNKITIT